MSSHSFLVVKEERCVNSPNALAFTTFPGHVAADYFQEKDEDDDGWSSLERDLNRALVEMYEDDPTENIDQTNLKCSMDGHAFMFCETIPAENCYSKVPTTETKYVTDHVGYFWGFRYLNAVSKTLDCLTYRS